MTVSDCGKYLATGGDKTIKIWDYSMSLDINFQVCCVCVKRLVAVRVDKWSLLGVILKK